MPIHETTRRALARRLEACRGQRWPQLSDLTIRNRTTFAYLQGATYDGDYPLPLCRLRYLGSANNWGFAIYLASKDGYEDSILPRGSFPGTPEAALDCACGFYLTDVTACIDAAKDDTKQDSGENFCRGPLN